MYGNIVRNKEEVDKTVKYLVEFYQVDHNNDYLYPEEYPAWVGHSFDHDDWVLDTWHMSIRERIEQLEQEIKELINESISST